MLTYVEPPGFVRVVGGTAGDGAAALTINVSHLAASVSIFFSVHSDGGGGVLRNLTGKPVSAIKMSEWAAVSVCTLQAGA